MSIKINSAPLPPDLKAPHPETPWRITSSLFQRVQSQESDNNNTPYKKVLLNSSDPEYSFVSKYFCHNPPPNRALGKVYILHNPHQNTSFESAIPTLEEESKGKAFKPSWKEEKFAPELREKAHHRWKSLTEAFSPFQIQHTAQRKEKYTQVKVLPLFHGSSADKCDSIARTGFTYFGKHKEGKKQSTDIGFFGSGIYFTTSAKYATDIYSDGENLLLAWVSMREPYPVVSDTPDGLYSHDMEKLPGKGAYENYNAHYIPVVPSKPQDPHCATYYPCSKNQEPHLDELVVFQSRQTLPRFWITLVVDLPQEPSTPKESLTVGALLDHLLALLDNPTIKQHPHLAPLIEQKSDALFKLEENTLLSPEDREFYRKISRLVDTQGKIRDTVAKFFISSPQAPKAEKEELFLKPSIPLTPPAKTTPVSTMVSPLAFGKADWAKYFGGIGIEPPLPPNIEEILNSPCPFWKDKKVKETHLLTLIPATVSGEPLTLKKLGELVKKPLQGNKTQYSNFYLGSYKDTPTVASHWALLTRDAIPNSRNKSYAEQQKLVQNVSSYTVPTLLDATTSIFLEYVKTGTRFYNDSPWTYTRCQEKYDDQWQLVVGGFAPGGLDVVSYSGWDGGDRGVGGLRKL